MEVNWLGNKKAKVSSDVEINLVGRKTKNVAIYFSNGAMATKFKNADRIMVGFDEDNKYLCFAPGGTAGYKVVKGNDRTAKIQISEQMFRRHREAHELCGSYVLEYDPEAQVSYIEIKSFS